MKRLTRTDVIALLGVTGLVMAAGAILLGEPALWRDHRGAVLGAAAIVLTQLAVIVALVIRQARRREAESQHAATLRAMPDAVVLFSRSGTWLGCHLPESGPSLELPDACIGRRIRDVWPPAIAQRFEQAFAALGAGTLTVEFELGDAQDEKAYRAHLAACGPDRVLALVRDVTERKRAESAIAEAGDRYDLARAAGGVGVWDWDLTTNAIYVDPFLKGVLGYEDHEIRNVMEDWSQHVHPDDRAEVEARVRDHLDGHCGVFEAEHRMRHRDGSVRWFLAKGSAVRVDGKAVRLVGTDTDITARKTTELALHHAQAELDRLARFAALGEFSASLAHEIRQPLTVISTNAEVSLRWLRGSPPDTAAATEAIADIVRAAERAEEVIHSYDDLFRHKTVQKSGVDLNRVVQEAVSLVRKRIREHRIDLTLRLASDLPDVDADGLELQRALLNLIGNAIEAMSDDEASARTIVVETSRHGEGFLRVSVVDSGIGLDGIDMDRLFLPWYTTKTNGSGVGLSVCRAIVNGHGGRLWAEPNPSRGATFSFTLPLPTASSRTRHRDGDAAAATPEDVGESSGPHRGSVEPAR